MRDQPSNQATRQGRSNVTKIEFSIVPNGQVFNDDNESSPFLLCSLRGILSWPALVLTKTKVCGEITNTNHE